MNEMAGMGVFCIIAITWLVTIVNLGASTKKHSGLLAYFLLIAPFVIMAIFG